MKVVFNFIYWENKPGVVDCQPTLIEKYEKNGPKPVLFLISLNCKYLFARKVRSSLIEESSDAFFEVGRTA